MKLPDIEIRDSGQPSPDNFVKINGWQVPALLSYKVNRPDGMSNDPLSLSLTLLVGSINVPRENPEFMGGIASVRKIVEQLQGLLADPQPGLYSWLMAYRDAICRIVQYSGDADLMQEYGEQSTTDGTHV